jgi:type VI secretion system secreted protein VgrG
MGKYTQDNRLISVTTPLGKDILLLESFSGVEEVSRLFRFDLEMLAESKTAVKFDQLLGKALTVTVLLPDGTKRYISGICDKLTESEEVVAAQGEQNFIRYRAEIVPSFWLLTRKVQTRIFQQLSVPDILKKVITGDVSWQIQGDFKPRDYVVQYRESDFAFASRLMEEEGIFYFFKHTSSGHQMIVANNAQAHQDIQDPTKIMFDELRGAAENELRINVWAKQQELTSGKSLLWDYCFEMPDKNLAADKPIKATAKSGTETHKLKVGGNDQFEIYDFPGAYAGRFDGIAPGGGDQASKLQDIFKDNERTVGIRMEQETVRALTISGESDCRHFVTGSKFTLEKHFNGDGTYLLTRIEHKGFMRGAYTTGGKVKLDYENTFECLPVDIPYRPERTTPRPVVHGTHTAVVVGPDGEEIFTDKYGRVKVQFHWDRDGKNDASSSCWIRVGTPWAGKQWGMVHIPRIGQEVIVAFLEGDPDQPIIVGSVYNAQVMPPYTLPDNKTQSGIKSRSSLKGEAEHFNELRFEDKKDSEQVYFHAQKNYDRVVENNDTLKVGSDKADDGSQTIEIWKNRTETIKEGDEKVTLEKGNQTIQIQKNRTETLKEGDEKVTLEKGSRTHSIKTDDTLTIEGKHTITVTGDQALTIKSGNQTIKVSSGKIATEAAQSIELKVGGATVKIEPSAITLTMGAGSVKVEASAVTTTCGGGSVKVEPGGVTIQAPQIKLAAGNISIG